MKIHVSNNNKRLKESGMFSIPDFTILTGENGAGKTQLLQAIVVAESNALRDVIDLSIAISLGDIWEHSTPTILFFDDDSPMTRISMTPPGMVGNSQEVFNISQHIERAWPALLRVKQSLPLLDGRKFADAGQKLSALNQEFRNYITSNVENPAITNNNSIKTIFAQDLLAIERIATVLNKPAELATKIDYLITLEIEHGLFSPLVDLLFHQYHLKTKHYPSLVEGLKPPVDLFNEILESMNLNYLATYIESDNDFIIPPVTLIDQTNGGQVKINDLSSGEKTIMTLIFTLYNSISGGAFPEALLFDEPDAFLHPSMCKTFLDVVQDTIVGKNNIKVLMTTHSPSTIALAPKDNIFLMKKDIGYPVQITRDEAIKTLTNGLVIVTDSTKYILVEDQDDKDFYSYLLSELIKQGFLNNDMSLVFIPASTSTKSGGKDAVRNWVEKQKELGLPSIILGLIDEDYGNTAKDGVYVLGRYSIENYLIDPLYVYAALMDKEKHPTIEGVSLRVGEEFKLKELEQDQLQKISDFIITKVEPKLSQKFDDFNPSIDSEKIVVKLTNERELLYPKWLFSKRGKTLLNEVFISEFGNKNINFKSLSKAMRKLNFFPMEIVDKFNELNTND